MNRKFPISALSLAGALLFLPAAPLLADTYAVTSMADDGSEHTLRWAIEQANADPGSTITLADNLGTITLAGALPIIWTSVTIEGGEGNTISGAGQYRIFFVDAGAADAVNIRNLTLADGYAKGGNGGPSGGGGLGAGGAIFVNKGAVTIEGVRFSDNAARGGNGGDGVVESGSFILSAVGVGGGGGGLGGNGGTGNGLSGGGGGGYGGDGGDAGGGGVFGRGAGGGGGIIGDGGDGSGGVSGVGGGGGGFTDGGTPAPGTGGGTGGGDGDPFHSGNGSSGSFGGGGGGGKESYNALANGGDGGAYGGGGGGSSQLQDILGRNAGNGGVFGGGGGAAGRGGDAGNGGFGGGGGGVAWSDSTSAISQGGDGGFGGGGGGVTFAWAAGGSAGYGGVGGGYNISSALYAGPGAGGGGGGAALGGAIFVRSDNGATLEIADSEETGSGVTGGSAGWSPPTPIPSWASLVPATNGGALGGAMFLPAGETVFRSGAFTGDIAGVPGAAIRKTTGGALSLGGNNSFSGGVRLDEGTLEVAGGGALGSSGTISFNGGVLRHTAANTADYSARFSSADNQQYRVDTGGQNVQWSAALVSAGGSLTKSGDGVLTLVGQNTYTGATVIEGGTLRIRGITGFQLEADSGVTTVGGNVASWADQSGFGNDAVMGPGAVTVGSLSTGQPALVFNGASGQYLNDQLSSSSGAYTIFAVVEPSSISAIGTIVGSSANGNLQFRLDHGTPQLVSQSVVNLALASSSVDAGSPALLTATVASGAQSFFIGTSAAGGGSASYTPQGGSTVRIGGNANNNELFDGSIAALLVYSTVLTAPEIAQVQAYLSGKYFGGLAAELPVIGVLPAGTALSLPASGGVLDLDDSRETIGALSGVAGSLIYLGKGSLTVGGDGTSTTYEGSIRDEGGASANIGGRLVKTGAGTLTLTGANTAGMTVNAGTLQLGDSGAVLSDTGAVTVNGGIFALGAANEAIGALSGAGGVIELFNGAGRTLTVNQTADGIYAGIIQGSGGALVKQGPGTLALAGANTWTGGTTISAGTLQIGSGGASGSVTGNITNNAALAFNRSDEITYSVVISGTGAVIQQGAGTLRLSGNNTYAGGTVLNAGILAIGSNNALSTGPITINGGNIRASGAPRTVANNVILNGGFTLGRVTTFSGPVTLIDDITITSANPDTSGASTSTFSGVISGNYGLAFTEGANPIGTIVLSGANTYTGGTTLNAGTLRLGNSGSVLADTGALAVNGGVFALGTADETVGALSGAGGVIELFNGTGRTLTVNQSADGVFAGVLQGSGGQLIKQGPGTLALTGNNAFTGAATISAGALQIGNGGETGAVGGDIVNHAALVFNRSNDLTYGGVISGEGTLAKQGAGTLTLTGVNTSTGATTISQGALRIGDGGESGAVTGDIINHAALVFNRSNDFTYDGVISGAGTVTKLGAGNLTLSTGTTVIEGTLAVAEGSLRIGSGATLQLGSGGMTGTLSGNVTIDGALVFSRSDNLSYSGVISGEGALTKLGAGRLTLSGENTYAGGTVIGAGTLAFDSFAALGTGGVRIDPGGILDLGGRTIDTAFYTLAGGTLANGVLDVALLDSQSAGTVQAALTGSAGFTKTTAATLSFTGANTYTGTTTIDAGTLQIGNGGETGNVAGDIVNHAALVFNRSDDFTYSGAISGGGTLTKLGAGALTLASGTTVIESTLTVAEGSLRIGADATLQLGNGGATGMLSGNFTLDGTLVLDRSDNLTFSPATSGDGSLVKQGANTVVVEGALGHAGGTVIDSGTLQVGAGGVVSAPAADFTNNGTLVFNHSNSFSYGGAISGAGALVKSGPGTLALTGSNTYTGATTINNGTLSAAAPGVIGGPVTLNGGTLSIDSDEAFVDPSALITVHGGGVRGGGAARVIANPLALSGNFTAGPLADFTGPITLDHDAAIIVDGSKTLGGVISGGHSLTISGGTLALTGANTFTGNVTVKSRLDIGTDAALGNASNALILDGGTLQATGSFTNGRTIGLTASGGLLSTGGYDLTFAGVSGPGDFKIDNRPVILGPGSLRLTGSSNIGALTFEFGTLTLARTATMTATSVNLGSRNDPGVLTLEGDTGSRSVLATGQVTAPDARFPTPQFVFDGGILRATDSNPFFLSGLVFGGNPPIQGRITLGSGGGFIDSNGYDIGTRNNTVLTGEGGLTKLGEGTLTLNAGNTYTGGTTLNAGILAIGSNGALSTGPLTINGGTIRASGAPRTVANNVILNGDFTLGRLTNFTGPVTLNADITITSANPDAGGASTSTLSGVISGNYSLTFTEGANPIGAVVLTGNNTYSGNTTVAEGRLVVNNTAGSATGTGRVTVEENGVLAGSGIVSGEVVLRGMVAPGNSIGTLTTGAQTWNEDGNYVWEINNATGGGGTGWDLLSIGGTLLVSGTIENPFIITVDSPFLANVVPGTTYHWTIATASGGISGFDPGKFSIDTSQFAYDPNTDDFTITVEGNDLVLNYTAVPEPGTWALLGLGLGAVAFLRKRRG